ARIATLLSGDLDAMVGLDRRKCPKRLIYPQHRVRPTVIQGLERTGGAGAAATNASTRRCGSTSAGTVT
ncbi:hypothetical protein, partial [Rhodoplanes sp. SY1]|uniref:hypothetical protein n=1 Tax=Rhodoplanes sp. SY1 TaxID=3166646 RepID=UPI0038B59C8F